MKTSQGELKEHLKTGTSEATYLNVGPGVDYLCMGVGRIFPLLRN